MRAFNKITMVMAALIILSCIFCSFRKSTGSNAENGIKSSKYCIIGYVYSRGQVLPENIAVEKMTHVNYSFGYIKDGLFYTPQPAIDSQNLKILNDAKVRNPDLKIIISLGGWEGSGGFSDMALTQQSRKRFISSTIGFVKTNAIDGVDIDWEYPGMPGAGNTCRPEDKENFTALLKEFREALDSLGNTNAKKYWLTIAANSTPQCVSHMEVGKFWPYLDYINIMTYDFTGGWDAKTGHHTNLYPSDLNPQANSASKAVHVFQTLGVPSEKLVIGAAFYGRGWTNVTNADNGLYQSASTVGAIEAGFDSLMINFIGKNGFVRYWDKSAKAPYLWNNATKTFVTYDDPESVKFKCKFIKANSLGGIMFWQYSGDYQNELLSVMRKNL